MNSEQNAALYSFGRRLKSVVIGSSGGIGAALTRQLGHHPAVQSVVACSRSSEAPSSAKIHHMRLDLEDERTIAAAADQIGEMFGSLDLIVVATGILHNECGLRPEKTWQALEAANLEQVFRINAIGPALIAKHFLPLLNRDRKSVFAALSARVGSIGDNQLGGWHAYRASKAALNMLIRNFAIELKRRNGNAIAVGLHPGTTETDLSKPFQANVPEGKLFSPDFAANRLLHVIDDLQPEDSGRQFAWDGKAIPF